MSQDRTARFHHTVVLACTAQVRSTGITQGGRILLLGAESFYFREP
jgi:hypothetical protein